MPKQYMRTLADGEAAAIGICCQLVTKSKWFEVIPLPDGIFEIFVKRESGLPETCEWVDA